MSIGIGCGLAGAPSVSPLATGAGDRPSPLGVGEAPLLHHVFFWLKNPDSEGQRAQLIEGLKALRDIPVIRELHVGVPAATEGRDVIDRSYDVSELMVFDTLADQASYQAHPIHLAFVETCGHLWRRVVVYDTAKA